jgi:hypothetical protein
MALVPLEQVTEFAGEQMMFYLGKYRGDLLMITLQKFAILYKLKI